MKQIRAVLSKYSDDLAILLSKSPDEIIGGRSHHHETFESLEQKRDDVLEDGNTQMRFAFLFLQRQ